MKIHSFIGNRTAALEKLDMSNYRDRYNDSNRNARISSRVDRTGKLRTETQRRDEDSLKMAVSTDQKNNSTRLFIDLDGVVNEASVTLDGRQARSLYRLLRKHYGKTGKSRTA
jgi:hypothetical protein